eukprot:gene23121-1409_t
MGLFCGKNQEGTESGFPEIEGVKHQQPRATGFDHAGELEFMEGFRICQSTQLLIFAPGVDKTNKGEYSLDTERWFSVLRRSKNNLSDTPIGEGYAVAL